MFSGQGYLGVEIPSAYGNTSGTIRSPVLFIYHPGNLARRALKVTREDSWRAKQVTRQLSLHITPPWDFSQLCFNHKGVGQELSFKGKPDIVFVPTKTYPEYQLEEKYHHFNTWSALDRKMSLAIVGSGLGKLTDQRAQERREMRKQK
jgi:hypothetical protein